MRLQLSTDEQPERQRFEFWHDAVCQDLFQVTPTPLFSLEGFRAKLDVQRAGQFALAQMHTTHGSIEKTASDTARGVGDSVLVFLAVEAAHRYQMGRHEVVIEQGDIGILPTAERFSCAAGGIAFRSMKVPAGILGPFMAGREVTRAERVPAAHPLNALLAAGLTSAMEHLPQLSEPMGEAVLRNLTGLVALALGASSEGRETGRAALRSAKLAQVKRFIAANLADPALTPGMAAVAAGISLRQLHALFEPSGESFSQHVLRERLNACRTTLSDPASLQRSIADVAFGWGFNSLSVFYRAFSTVFGMPPGSVREMVALSDR